MKTYQSIMVLMALVLLFVSGTLQQNFDFADALSVNPADSISLDNSASPDDAVLSLCTELSSASSFLWYKIDSSSSLRIFTFDTCDVDYDSVIGVFSGSDFSSLVTLGCNDDRIKKGINSCNPSSSLIQNISVPSGETIYIVVGSFLDPYTGLPSLGTGHLLITEVDPSSLECSADLILQVQQDLELDLSNLQSTVTSAITTSQNHIESDITDAQTAILAAIDDAESALDIDIQGVQTTANSIQSTVTSTSSTVTSISSLLSTVDGKVDDVITDIGTVEGSITTVSGKISTLSSGISTQFTDTNTNIDALQTAADQIIDLNNQLVSGNVDIEAQQSGIVSQLTSFSTSVASSFTALGNDMDTIDGDLLNINAALDDVDSHLNTIDGNIGTLGSSIDSLSTSTTSKFSSTNTNIDQVQASADQIVILVNQVITDDASIGTQNDNIADQITAFGGNVDDSFTEVMGDLSDITSDLMDARDASQSSFDAIGAQIGGVQSTSNSIKSDTSSSLSILNNLQSNIRTDSASNVFLNTIARYLSDTSVITPLTLRIPNTFGGRMDDAAAYVTSQYTALKSSALAVGVKGSAECNSNAFCNFFLGTADAAYSDSIVKYNTYMSSRKFSIAYSYLQQAFINLFPSTW